MGHIKDSKHLLTGGGIETYLIFIQNVQLREFCGFEIYRQEEELAKMEMHCLTPMANAALASGHDLLLDVLTWRAHADFVRALGYPDTSVEDINYLAVKRARAFASHWCSKTSGSDRISVFLNGDIGPRGDGYRFDGGTTVESALGYHRRQIRALAEAQVDAINALTMTNVSETVGIVKAAQEVGLPCIVSPTVEIDGTTPEGLSLGRFIEEVEVATEGSPLFYMVNCAHPTHLEPTLRRARELGERWLSRLRGFRANASHKSHEELDNSTTLDRGCPEALASQIAHLQADFGLRLVGGCCGTDAEHITKIAHAVANRRSIDDSLRAADTSSLHA